MCKVDGTKSFQVFKINKHISIFLIYTCNITKFKYLVLLYYSMQKILRADIGSNVSNSRVTHIASEVLSGEYHNI